MKRWIIGGGMTGLAAGMASGYEVLERSREPGGLCATYHRGGYRFEPGGGHWVFADNDAVMRLMAAASPVRMYRRHSAVLFLGGIDETAYLRHVVVPYPIQDNLFGLSPETRKAVLAETSGHSAEALVETMAEWLRQRFGATLCRIFFDPFHERYTAGIYRTIAPQDTYKSPVDVEHPRRGAAGNWVKGGYNAMFVYPVRGLGEVSRWLAARCTMRYGNDVIRIDAGDRILEMADGTVLPYGLAIATIPLNYLIDIAGLREAVGPPDPWTSVLVLNLGVKVPNTRLARHGYHWLYVPDSRSGFHRIGYYSNVDPGFLPPGRRGNGHSAAIYVERAFPGGERPTAETIHDTEEAIIAELKEHSLIDAVEVAHSTWVDVAYTWRHPRSDWTGRALSACEAIGIRPAGRYGRWHFQGIAASLNEGLVLGRECTGSYSP